MKAFHLACLSLSLLIGGVAQATAEDLLSITGMQSRNRVLMVFAPSFHDNRLTAQRSVMARLAVEASRRDLLFVQIDPKTVIGASDKGNTLRRRYRVPATAYHAFLLDKDGRVLGDSTSLFDGPAIVRLIDATPARRSEIQRARAGRALGTD